MDNRDVKPRAEEIFPRNVGRDDVCIGLPFGCFCSGAFLASSSLLANDLQLHYLFRIAVGEINASSYF